MGLTLDPHYKFTEAAVRQYAAKNGELAAIEWLALIPPDRFDGNWQKVYDELESAIYWKGLESAIYWGNDNGNGSTTQGSKEV